MLISNRKVSIPFIADAKLPIFWPGSKNYDFLHQICDFKGENWRAGLRRLKFLSLRDHNICQKNDQNSVFLSEALHGEIIIWNNQIFEEGYLSYPKYLGPTVWFNIQLVPKSFPKYYWILLWLWLFMTQVVKYTMKVKVIKYFLQIFVIWNNGGGKKWGARYTFWYIVLLTLCNGDRRIVQSLVIWSDLGMFWGSLGFFKSALDWWRVIGARTSTSSVVSLICVRFSTMSMCSSN